jgi:hypothetical protein
MGPQAFFQALARIAAIGSLLAIVWIFLYRLCQRCEPLQEHMMEGCYFYIYIYIHLKLAKI